MQMKPGAVFLFLFFAFTRVTAQQGFVVHLTIDKVFLGSDSLVFKKGKTWVLHIKSKTDTVEIGQVRGTPVAIIADVQRVLVNKRVQFKIGYAFYKKVFGRWELIRHFGYVARYDLVQAEKNFETGRGKKTAKEEYNCQWSDPALFSAKFRMDVYKE